jgi:hypothetical protein
MSSSSTSARWRGAYGGLVRPNLRRLARPGARSSGRTHVRKVLTMGGEVQFGRISSGGDGLGRPAVLDSGGGAGFYAGGGAGFYAGGGARLGEVRGGTRAGPEPSHL